MRHKENGFTLIELMVTIAVMAIIAMMAAPNLMPLVYKKQLDTSARELAQTMAKVRGTAIALRKEVSLEFKDTTNTDHQFYWLPGNDQIHVLAKATPEGITFSPVGLANKRTTSLKRYVRNPNYDPNLDEDPLTNPKLIIEWQDTEDLVFELCHEKVGEIKSIKIFKSGLISNIETKEKVGSCT